MNLFFISFNDNLKGDILDPHIFECNSDRLNPNKLRNENSNAFHVRSWGSTHLVLDDLRYVRLEVLCSCEFDKRLQVIISRIGSLRNYLKLDEKIFTTFRTRLVFSSFPFSFRFKVALKRLGGCKYACNGPNVWHVSTVL